MATFKVGDKVRFNESFLSSYGERLWAQDLINASKASSGIFTVSKIIGDLNLDVCENSWGYDLSSEWVELADDTSKTWLEIAIELGCTWKESEKLLSFRSRDTKMHIYLDVGGFTSPAIDYDHINIATAMLMAWKEYQEKNK